MILLGLTAIFLSGFAWGRLQSRRRTRADLMRLTKMIVDGIPVIKDQSDVRLR